MRTYDDWDDDEDDFDLHPRRRRANARSAVLGLISCCLAVAALALGALIVALFIADESASPRSREAIEILGGLSVLAFFAAALTGLVLGLVGVSQAGQDRTFAFIGLYFNGLILVGFVVLVCIGFLTERM